MRVAHHLLVFRLGLFGLLLVPSLNCVRGDEVPEACGCAGCGDFPIEDIVITEGDDDDSALGDDDDAGPEVDLTEGLAACEEAISDELLRIAGSAPRPGGTVYRPESEDLQEMVWTSFGDLLDGFPQLAAADAALVDYLLCKGEEEERGMALWRPVERGTGAARVVFRGTDAAPLIIGVPHAVSTPETLDLAFALFEATEARALIVGSTHRCAAVAAAPCTSLTTACTGEDQIATVSDMSRHDASVFHAAHAFFGDEYPDHWVLTIDALEDDGLALSDGTGSVVSAGAVRAVASSIASMLPDVDATTCNDGLALPREARSCGTEDVQGRWVNASAEASCDDAPTEGVGRYVHLAAAPDVLAADALIEAIGAALP